MSGDARQKRDTLTVFFHGGGFVEGDLEDTDMFLRFLADFFGAEHPGLWRIYLHSPDGLALTSADNFALELKHHVYWLHLDCTE